LPEAAEQSDARRGNPVSEGRGYTPLQGSRTPKRQGRVVRPRDQAKKVQEKVLVTDIQRFSVNDGPGFRTNVYLKGCPMRCAWCHNPEAIAPYPEIYWKRRLCVQCGKCLEVCPRNAIEPPIPPEAAQSDGSTYHKIIRSRCDRCMLCLEACLYEALQIVGKPMSVEEILEEVWRDKPFYDNSGGGMTLSGGEPAAHPEFTQSLLRQAKGMGLHTCLDTNGFCEWAVLEQMARYTDIVLFDLKHLDPEIHCRKTGVDNAPILKNLALLAKTGREIWVRIPVVPDFNDAIGFHTRAAEFLSALPGRIARVDLLPFHNWCQDKYGWLGLEWDLREVDSLDPVFLEIPAEIYRERGLAVTIGGSGFEEAGAAAV